MYIQIAKEKVLDKWIHRNPEDFISFVGGCGNITTEVLADDCSKDFPYELRG
ncbi:MAG: hypothetical protein HOI53_09195 [Francisellaceae bacterium]|jgi:hypothetical protein|nr:hypothetical protein [Francisellaceae bacterium]MBT6208188.1 hypothetical protein [Francisellaceae bacterium]MBT6538890.1 hypothetical protein [Francisellaceae bacterium]